VTAKTRPDDTFYYAAYARYAGQPADQLRAPATRCHLAIQPNEIVCIQLAHGARSSSEASPRRWSLGQPVSLVEASIGCEVPFGHRGIGGSTKAPPSRDAQDVTGAASYNISKRSGSSRNPLNVRKGYRRALRGFGFGSQESIQESGNKTNEKRKTVVFETGARFSRLLTNSLLIVRGCNNKSSRSLRIISGWFRTSGKRSPNS